MTDNVWVADLEFVTEQAPLDMALQLMAAEGERHEWAVSALGRQPGARVLVYLDELSDQDTPPLGVMQVVGSDVIPWVDKFLPGAMLTSARLLTEHQLELEALTPSIPELVAAADVAKLLGVSRQRVSQLATSNARFPAPIVRLSTGPLWTREAIDWFATVWERKPGRPRAQRAGSARRARVGASPAKNVAVPSAAKARAAAHAS